MRIPLPAGKRRARIEIIPLIDIVFFLLATFVMVSLSMVKNRGVPVNLPAARTGLSAEKDSVAILTVTEDDELYFNKEKISVDELPARLQSMKAAVSETRVFIAGDQRAFFGRAVLVLDEVRKAGIHKVSILTKGASE